MNSSNKDELEITNNHYQDEDVHKHDQAKPSDGRTRRNAG